MWYPDNLTPAQLEARRVAAARLLRSGRLSRAEIARRLGVTRPAVHQWATRLHRTGGVAGLRRRPHPGRPARLRARDWARLFALLRRGARASGFDTERWTLRRIAVVLERELGVSYHPHSLSALLRARGAAARARRVAAAPGDPRDGAE